MNIENIQALIAQGLLTDTVSLDLTTTYVTVGVYQPGNRQNGPSGNAYPSYVLPLSQLAGSTYTASNGIALVGNDFQLSSILISQFTNDSGYLVSADLTGYVQGVGTIGYLPRWDLTDTLGNSIIFDDGLGHVGIGTAVPSHTFEVNGTLKVVTGNHVLRDLVGVPSFGAMYMNVTPGVSNYVLASNGPTLVVNGPSEINFAVNNSSKAIMDTNKFNVLQPMSVGSIIPSGAQQFVVGGLTYIQGTGSTSATYALKVDNSANSPLLYVRNDGNVGMGESNPTAKLQILKNTVGTGQKGLSVNFATIGEVFYIDDNGAAVYNANAGFTIKGGNGSLSIISNGGVNPSLAFKYNNGASDSGILFGNGASMFMNTPALGLGGATNFNPSARLHIQGLYDTSGYALKIDNSASSPLLYVRNDGYTTIMDMVVGRGGGLISTNTVLGVAAIANATGGQNTGVGYAVLNTLNTGTGNTAIGYAVLANITSGTTNVGIGASVMQASNPSYSIGIGSGVLYQSSGTGNTGIGHGNFYNLSLGDYNTALGYNAGANVMHTQGNNNLFLGYMADVSTNNLTNASAIGANATVGASNSMVLGNGVNVGIGSSTPTSKLQVVGLPTYADNTAASGAGLTVGAMYIRTGHGLDIVV